MRRPGRERPNWLTEIERDWESIPLAGSIFGHPRNAAVVAFEAPYSEAFCAGDGMFNFNHPAAKAAIAIGVLSSERIQRKGVSAGEQGRLKDAIREFWEPRGENSWNDRLQSLWEVAGSVLDARWLGAAPPAIKEQQCLAPVFRHGENDWSGLRLIGDISGVQPWGQQLK